MKARSTVLGLVLGSGVLLLAGAAPESALAQCCAPPPPPCCVPPPPPPPPPPPCCGGHKVNIPGVNVFVAPTVVVNAKASARVDVSAGAAAGASAAGLAGSAVFFGGGGGGGFFSPPVATGVVQALDVEGLKKRVAYEATRTVTKRVVIQAVCIDDRQIPHPAARITPDRDVAEVFEGELYRCVAGARLQATIAEFDGKVDFSGGKTLACRKGEALYHAPGGVVECRPAKPQRDCYERSLLRRFGTGVKVLTMRFSETYTAYREEVISESVATTMSLDGGVGGVVF